jgi:flavorubredoxin
MTRALVLYHSQEYGNTKLMAEAVAQGLKETGCEVTIFNTNDGRFDVTTFPEFDCVAFGSPDYFSYIAGGLKTFMDDHYVESTVKKKTGYTGKPYALFCSHGGGGKVKNVMQDLFRRVGRQVGDIVSSQGRPNQQTLEKCRELGRQLGKAAAQPPRH